VDDKSAVPVAPDPDAVSERGPLCVLMVAAPVEVVCKVTPVAPVSDTVPELANTCAPPVDAVTLTPVAPLIDTLELDDCNNTLPLVALTVNGPLLVLIEPEPAPDDEMDTPVDPDKLATPPNAFIEMDPDTDTTDTPVAPFSDTMLLVDVNVAGPPLAAKEIGPEVVDKTPVPPDAVA